MLLFLPPPPLAVLSSTLEASRTTDDLHNGPWFNGWPADWPSFNVTSAQQQIQQCDSEQQEKLNILFFPYTLALEAERLVHAASLYVMACSFCEETVNLKETLLNFTFSFARTL